MATPPKILAIGSSYSSLSKLATKISAFEKSYGPFQACYTVGNLFNKNETGDCLSDSTGNQVEFPIPTYFPQSSYPLPDKIKQKIDASGPEIAKNLIYLAGEQGCGVFKAGNGSYGVGFVAPPPNNQDQAIQTLFDNQVFLDLAPAPSLSPATSAQNVITQEVNINPTTAGSSASTPKDVSLAEARAQAKKESKEKALQAKTSPGWAKGLDVLILNGVNFPNAAHGSEGSLGDFIRRARPRYVLHCEDAEATQEAGDEAKDAEMNTEEDGEKVEGSQGTKSRYEEKLPFGWTSRYGREERWTRVIRLDRFAEPSDDSDALAVEGSKPKKAKGEKKKFFYAFSLPDLAASSPVRPEAVGVNPFVSSARGSKRPGDEADSNGNKKPKHGELRDDYICKICSQPGHHIRDCPDKGKPRGPPPDYVCHRCNQGGHFIRDCPEPPSNQASGPRKEVHVLSVDECWFCLANSSCDTRFITSVHNDAYVALSKGQLIKTGDSQNPPLVPGGGHLLIIPIQHVANPLLLPDEESLPLLTEITEIKSQIRKAYAVHDAVPVFCDMYRNNTKAQHGQIQAIPIPRSRAGQIEDMLRKAAEAEGWKWEEGDGETLLKQGKGREFIRIDLPDGKVLVHFIHGRFNLQFARSHLADFLGTPDRANWQVCQTTDAQVKKDVAAYKKISA